MGLLRFTKIMDICLIQYGMRESYDLSFMNVKNISINDILKYMNEKIRSIYKFTGTINELSSNIKIIEIIPTETAYVRSIINEEKYTILNIDNTDKSFPIAFSDMGIYNYHYLFETNKAWENIIIKNRSEIEM